jgi:hypothetical protein
MHGFVPTPSGTPKGPSPVEERMMGREFIETYRGHDIYSDVGANRVVIMRPSASNLSPIIFEPYSDTFKSDPFRRSGEWVVDLAFRGGRRR